MIIGWTQVKHWPLIDNPLYGSLTGQLLSVYCILEKVEHLMMRFCSIMNSAVSYSGNVTYVKITSLP